MYVPTENTPIVARQIWFHICGALKGNEVTEQYEVTVHYDMFDEYVLHEAHIYVGCNMYPVNNAGKPTVAPGQYTYNAGTLEKVQDLISFSKANEYFKQHVKHHHAKNQPENFGSHISPGANHYRPLPGSIPFIAAAIKPKAE